MGFFKSDIEKYKKYSVKSSIVLLLTTQGLWALFVYRMSSLLYKKQIAPIFKKPLLIFAMVGQKWIEIVTGISIPYTAQIGNKFYIGHFGGIIISPNAVIGNNCNISQGVTIGVSGKGENRGVPVIGNNVYIGANAVLVGGINVGDNCVIAANSLVIDSIDANCTVIGVPAKLKSNKTSKNYI